MTNILVIGKSGFVLLEHYSDRDTQLAASLANPAKDQDLAAAGCEVINGG
jgi:hypothetical protein